MYVPSWNLIRFPFVFHGISGVKSKKKNLWLIHVFCDLRLACWSAVWLFCLGYCVNFLDKDLFSVLSLAVWWGPKGWFTLLHFGCGGKSFTTFKSCLSQDAINALVSLYVSSVSWWKLAPDVLSLLCLLVFQDFVLDLSEQSPPGFY